MSKSPPSAERSLPKDQSWGGCRVCKHFQPGIRCAAFPDRIPLAIFSGEVDHLVVRPGQVGDTVFEVTDNPTDLQQRMITAAAARGAKWAIEALAKAEAAGAPAQQKGP